MSYCVYCITCLVNNKKYIGKTSSDTTRRWNDHIRSANNPSQVINFAMQKHGIDNFKFEILENFNTEDEAFEAEIKYIKKYKSLVAENGYNVSPGGKGTGGSSRKLSYEDAYRLIMDYIKRDYNALKLSAKYNLAKASILDILNRRYYLDLSLKEEDRLNLWLKLNKPHSPKFNEKGKMIKIKSHYAPEIFKLYYNGFSLTSIASKYGVRISNIKHILSRNTWKDVEVEQSFVDFAIKNINKEKVIALKQNKQKTRSNLTIDEVNFIISEIVCGKSIKELSLKFKEIKIINLLIGRSYKDIYGKLTNDQKNAIELQLINHFSKNSLFILSKIFEDYVNNKLSLEELSKKYKRSKSDIIDVLRSSDLSGNIKYIDLNIRNMAIKYINRDSKNTKWHRQNRLKDEDILNILNDYLNGLELKELDKKYPDIYVYDVLRLRFSFRGRSIDNKLIGMIKEKRLNSNKRHRMTAEMYENIARDYISGMTLDQLSDKYNFNNSTLHSALSGKTNNHLNINLALKKKLSEHILIRSKKLDK